MLPKLTTLLCLFATVTFAQTAPNFKFGKPNLEELKATVCPIDSAADAYIIGEYGDVRFDLQANKLRMIYNYTVRIKILKKSAFEWASNFVNYYRTTYVKEDVMFIKGFTYNLNGNDITTDKMGKDAIFEEQQGKDSFVKKFTLPNVKEGSVIEFNYETQSDSYTIPTWTFQTSIPTLWSQYNVKILEYFRYSTNVQGYEPMTISNITRGNQTILFAGEASNSSTTDYEMAIANAPAIRNEAYTTTIQDYVSKISFELARVDIPGQLSKVYSNTIKAINNTLKEDDDFGKQLNKYGFLDDMAEQIAKSTKDTLQQIEMAKKYIQSQLKWNNDNGIYTTESPKKIFENHAGNDADINLALVGMLRRMKLPANPILISTRSHGRVIDTNPQLKNFNYVIAGVNINGKMAYADATEPMANFIPERCLNNVGLRIGIDKEDANWVEIKPTNKDMTFTTMNMKLNDEGLVRGKLVRNQTAMPHSQSGIN